MPLCLRSRFAAHLLKSDEKSLCVLFTGKFKLLKKMMKNAGVFFWSMPVKQVLHRSVVDGVFEDETNQRLC